MRKQTFYALMFLHLLSPLAPGAVQLNGKALALQRGSSSALGWVETEPTQRGVPANCAAHGVHRQRASEESRSVGIRLGRRLGWVFERRLGGRGCSWGCCAWAMWQCRAERERRTGIEECRCRLGEDEWTML